MTAVTDRLADVIRAGGKEPRLDLGRTRRGPRVIRLRDVWERLSLPLVRSLVVSLVLALAGAGAALAVTRSRPGTYTSQATLLMDEPLAVAASRDAGVLGKLTALRPKYAALALTTPVLSQAADLAHLPLPTVAAAAVVTYPANVLTLQSVGVSSDPATARAVAESLGEALSSYVATEQAALAVPAPERLAVSVIDPAGPARKISPSVRTIATAAALTGVVVAVLAYLVTQLAFTRVRRL